MATCGIELGALYAAALPRRCAGRSGMGGRTSCAVAAASLAPATRRAEPRVPPSRMASWARHHAGARARDRGPAARLRSPARYRFEAWPALEIVVTPSFIRGQDGTASRCEASRDPDEAKPHGRMLRMRASPTVSTDEPMTTRTRDDDEDDGRCAECTAAGSLERAAALAMTERALRLAPDDSRRPVHARACCARCGAGGRLGARRAARLVCASRGRCVIMGGRSARAVRRPSADSSALAIDAARRRRVRSLVPHGARSVEPAMRRSSTSPTELFAELAASSRARSIVHSLLGDSLWCSRQASRQTQRRRRASRSTIVSLALPIPDDGDDARTTCAR